MVKPLELAKIEPTHKKKSGTKKIILVFFSAIIVGIGSTFWLITGIKPTQVLNFVPCEEIQISGVVGGSIMCLPKTNEKVPGVIAVPGWGGSAQSTEKICEYFVNKNWACLGVDSANDSRDELEVIADIRIILDYMKKHDRIDPGRMILWGGSNGGRIILIAAAGRKDVFAVAALSPPLDINMDEDDFLKLKNLDTNLIYIYGEFDFTNKETAQKLIDIVEFKGKRAKQRMIYNAGHEICCYNPLVLDIQYEFIQNLINIDFLNAGSE